MGKTKTEKPTMYVNVNRGRKGYRDKYKKDVDKALTEYAISLGKDDINQFTNDEWKKFFKTNLIPLDKESEQKMISLFKDDKDELNQLLILHNTLASDNIAEVYFKKYEKSCPSPWYDLDDFKQMAREGLAIATRDFDPSRNIKFITYATYWVWNRVMRWQRDKDAHVMKTSLDCPVKPMGDEESETDMMDVVTPDKIAPDANYDEDAINPVAIIDGKNTNENCDFYANLKVANVDDMSTVEMNKSRKMVKYLLSIVEKTKEYSDKQILLYMFKKVFKKCSALFPNENKFHIAMDAYSSEAAESKDELLSRIGKNEKQYEKACQNLVRKCYDGIQL